MKTIQYIEITCSEDIPGGAATILDPIGFSKEEVKTKVLWDGRIDVEITLDENDPRVPQVLALLALYKKEPWLRRRDIYTEDELQAARLLVVCPWPHLCAAGGSQYGTSYDMSNACQKCGTGARQTSPMNLDTEDLRRIEKLRIASTHHDELLVHDADAERLLAANVTGLVLWTVYAKRKNGSLDELRWQQMFADHVMPPMAPSSSLNRTDECPVCHRGGSSNTSSPSLLRFVYRPEDLVDIKDVNRTWEWFGAWREFTGDITEALWPSPRMLITPKVMNLLRGTKKDQGADFVPIWIEGQGDARAKPSYLPDHPLNM